MLNVGGQSAYLVGIVGGLRKIDGIHVDVVDADTSLGKFSNYNNVKFFNVRGDQTSEVSAIKKVTRITVFYIKLLRYVLITQAKVFHIQWFNKFEIFDRLFFTTLYKLFNKKVVFTAHNINKRARDKRDNYINRLSLSYHYKLVDKIIVHTPQMKEELLKSFKINQDKIAVIEHGINNDVKVTKLDKKKSKKFLEIEPAKKTLLFFGFIDIYKGVDFLVEAFAKLPQDDFQLVIAGEVKEHYVIEFNKKIKPYLKSNSIIGKIGFVPNNEIEYYFKAADCIVLPYKKIYQTGVTFLAYQFGTPVIAPLMANFEDDVVKGKTGFLFEPENQGSFLCAVEEYFSSELFKNLDSERDKIIKWANEKYSWDSIGEKTYSLYQTLLR